MINRHRRESLRISREALHVFTERVPLHLDLARSGYSMAAAEGGVWVHDLHIWSLSSGRLTPSAHVVIFDLSAWPAILGRLRYSLDEEFAFEHVTLQPEVRAWHIGVNAVNQSYNVQQYQVVE